MKLKIEFSGNEELVPFTYLSNLAGYLHKILGVDNEYHDDISLYSTSFLHGGKIDKNKKYLNFPDGAVWYISSPDIKFINEFIINIFKNVEFAFGMKLQGVEIIERKLFHDGDHYLFQTKSPILLKQRDFETKKNIYYTYEDDIIITSTLMKNIIIKKANKFNLNINFEDFEISFDYNYSNKKTRWITIKNINNKTSVCPIFVKTNNREIADFIYSVGIGHSTGCGFGFLL